jgi:REP element-mobilizing transposase RayT
MPKARKNLISVDTTPYYHCVSRCVRRAFLCGLDPFTKQSYEHRKAWIEQRILALGQVFCLDICAYAVMSNHYHVVLHINMAKLAKLSNRQVLARWFSLFQGNPLVARFLRDEPLCDAELAAITDIAAQWRERLVNISWFMKVLNESIARKANAEDGCTGKFWEGRFKSQALLDEKALAACMAYVDLNPVRASMAKTPEQSAHTSIRKRILALQNTTQVAESYQPKTLFPFVADPRQNPTQGLPFRLTEYLELLDWTGRMLHNGKHDAISQHLPPILERLNIGAKNWLRSSCYFEASFKTLAGALEKVKQAAETLGYQRTPSTGWLLT